MAKKRIIKHEPIAADFMRYAKVFKWLDGGRKTTGEPAVATAHWWWLMKCLKREKVWML